MTAEAEQLEISAKHCRQRAIDCETQAAGNSDPIIQQSYLGLSKTWRNLADQMDRLTINMARGK
jgi:hypothetical protein